MPVNYRELTLPDLILNRPGTITFRFILSIFGHFSGASIDSDTSAEP